MRVVLLSLLVFSLAFVNFAQEAKPVGDDPEVERRLLHLSQELRCLVCQNETLAESRAGLAEDLRNQIREQIKAGKSDKEIIAYLTERYGDFILYNPPVRFSTYLLWFGPFVLLIGGLLFLMRYLKQRRGLIVEKPLTQEEHRQVEELLDVTRRKESA